jgi:hypothetical protein
VLRDQVPRAKTDELRTNSMCYICFTCGKYGVQYRYIKKSKCYVRVSVTSPQFTYSEFQLSVRSEVNPQLQSEVLLSACHRGGYTRIWSTGAMMITRLPTPTQLFSTDHQQQCELRHGLMSPKDFNDGNVTKIHQYFVLTATLFVMHLNKKLHFQDLSPFRTSRPNMEWWQYCMHGHHIGIIYTKVKSNTMRTSHKGVNQYL